jgi:hypothetical protein
MAGNSTAAFRGFSSRALGGNLHWAVGRGICFLGLFQCEASAVWPSLERGFLHQESCCVAKTPEEICR